MGNNKHQQTQGFNPFTNLDATTEYYKQFERNETLIHQVFAQNDAGRELLDLFKNSLMMFPTVTPNSSQFQVGIEEGKKEFIRNIILTVEKVEGDI